jgi:hypothetical protein
MMQTMAPVDRLLLLLLLLLFWIADEATRAVAARFEPDASHTNAPKRGGGIRPARVRAH